jgi:uncharacterized protein (TIGR03084 family)
VRELTDLAAEQHALACLLDSLSTREWERPSAAAGWSVRDQVAHLADTEEVAADTLTGGPRSFARAVSRYRTAEDFTAAGCRRGRGRSPAELVGWWQTAAARTRGLLAGRAAAQRVAWGYGLTVRAFSAGRLMEHWAHGLDISDALAIPAAETPRLRHVARLGLDSLRYALARAHVRWPADRSLRLELAGADGSPYVFGPREATDVLRGPLVQWCRIAVQRSRGGGPAGLEPTGELAELALRHARAYL